MQTVDIVEFIAAVEATDEQNPNVFINEDFSYIMEEFSDMEYSLVSEYGYKIKYELDFDPSRDKFYNLSLIYTDDNDDEAKHVLTVGYGTSKESAMFSAYLKMQIELNGDTRVELA